MSQANTATPDKSSTSLSRHFGHAEDFTLYTTSRLSTEHRSLDTEIATHSLNSLYCSVKLSALKLRKLRMKEELLAREKAGAGTLH